MARTTLMNVVVGLILAMAASTGFASALTRAADKLVADQVDIGGWTDGSWPGETDFAGEPTIGLTHAYERTNNSDYKTAAENGGAYSLSYAGYDASNHRFTYGLFPAEMYAMARLSAIQADPHNNYWRTALVDNLNSLNAGAVVTWYQDTREDSAAAYDVARIAVAANYADHASKTVWRDGVITLLADVDENAASPVMALGAAGLACEALPGRCRSHKRSRSWAGGGVSRPPFQYIL